MKSAIEKIYYGTFADIEKIKLSAEQLKRLDIIIECDNKLNTLFKDNQEALALYERLKRALDDNACAEAITMYKEGFRNGFQLALDALNDE